MDISKVEIIREMPNSELQNESVVEELLFKVGLNAENDIELPSSMVQSSGGLLIWQYPNQFSKYIVFLSKLNVKTYLEIGCRWGGTFVFTCEYMNKLNGLQEGIAIDLIDSPVKTYCDTTKGCKFLKMDSHSNEFENFIKDKSFDCIFIDGDHSYDGVKLDYQKSRDHGRIFVFHDIISDVCPGVVKFWRDFKIYEEEFFTFYEFTDQYDEVVQRLGQKYLGIGVAVKKCF